MTDDILDSKGLTREYIQIGSSHVEMLPKNLIAVLPGRISNDRVPEAPALSTSRARSRRDGVARDSTVDDG